MSSCCFVLHTCIWKGVWLVEDSGVAGIVQDVPPLDGLDVTQQGIVGDLYSSSQNL